MYGRSGYGGSGGGGSSTSIPVDLGNATDHVSSGTLLEEIISHWPLATNFTDVLGNNTFNANEGPPTFSGGWCVFDGNDDAAVASNSTQNPSSWTINLTFQLTAYNNSDGAVLVSKYLGGSGRQFYIYVMQSNLRFAASTDGGGSYNVLWEPTAAALLGGDFQLNTPYHISFGFDNANNVLFARINNGTKLTTGAVGNMVNSGGQFSIGAISEGNGSPNGNQLTGKIKDMTFWGKVITDDENTVHYGGSAGSTPAYPFNVQSNISIDISQGSEFKVNLDSDAMWELTGGTPGVAKNVEIIFTQDGGGCQIETLEGMVLDNNTEPQVNTTDGAVTVIRGKYDGERYIVGNH